MTQTEINKIRKKIDLADRQIVTALAFRSYLIKEISNFKNPDKIYDARREKEIIANVITAAQEINLNPNFIKNIYKQILTESKRQLKIILKKNVLPKNNTSNLIPN